MGHKQPPTPMQTDNTNEHGAATNKIPRKRLKSMDMRLHWIRFRATKRKFCHYWRAGSKNLGDYVTKKHAAIHHQKIQPIYLTPKSQLDLLRMKAKIKENELMNKTAGRVC